MRWPGSHSPVFEEVFIQRDQLILTRRVDHLSADEALAGLRPVPIGSWAVR